MKYMTGVKRVCLVYVVSWVAAAMALPSSGSAQRRHSDAEIRNTVRIGVKNAIENRYGRSSDMRITKMTEGDFTGDDRRYTGEGTFLLGRDRRDFTFECFVDTRRVMTKGIKIHSNNPVDVHDVGTRAALAEVQSKHGRDSEPRLDEVNVADFDRDEKRVYGTGVFKNDGRRRSFNFECLVNQLTGQVRRMKIDEGRGRPGRPGFGDRPGSGDREGAISDRKAREYAETAVLDRLRADGVSGTVNITDSRIAENSRGQSRIEGEGDYRSTGRDHRFSFTCFVDMRTGRVERLRITDR